MNKKLLIPITILAVFALTVGVFLVAPKPKSQAITSYYVDSVSGSDLNSGASELLAFKTFSPISSKTLPAGTSVYLKRGSSWTGELTIRGSGTSSLPILVSAYGEGLPPTISNPATGGHGVAAIGDYIVVENLFFHDVQDTAVLLRGSHNIVRNSEMYRTGSGVIAEGQYNRVTNNYMHDLTAVKNTSDVFDDDYGCTGVWFFNGNNEADHNRIERAICDSYDYGPGGMGKPFQTYYVADYNSIHDNYTAWSDGFVEVGGGSANHMRIFRNVSYNNGSFLTLHLAGTFASQVIDFIEENNTIVEDRTLDPFKWSLLYFEGTPTNETFTFRNNIVWLRNFWYVAGGEDWKFQHYNNFYPFPNSQTKTGFPLGAGERIANPLFIDLANGDFRLSVNSPAIGAGYDGSDLGAFPYQPTITVTPTNTPTATPTKTSTPTPTRTDTPTGTFTPTVTRTPTSTSTKTMTPTATRTSTATRIITPTPTPAPTPKPGWRLCKWWIFWYPCYNK